MLTDFVLSALYEKKKNGRDQSASKILELFRKAGLVTILLFSGYMCFCSFVLT